MPIYAYKCSSCGMSKDILRKISDPALTLCPECGQEALEKQVTAAGFQLKGSGWYVTDFREGGKATTVPPVSGDKPAVDGGSQATTDAASSTAAEKSTAVSAPASTPSSAPAVSTPSTGAPT
jgi:putative FmdB family regulatory protein